MTATLYFLFAVASANLPLLDALASFPDKASCDAAGSAVDAAIKDGDDRAHVVCISSASLDDLGRANGLK